MVSEMRTIVGLVLATGIVVVGHFVPARLVDGAMPPSPPPTVVGWLDEMVDLTVGASGAVADVEDLGGTTDTLGDIARTWRFLPATLDDESVSSHVLAVAAIRPPQLFDGPTLGSEPPTIVVAREDLPHPTVTARPRYPPLGVGDAMVLVELLVDSTGEVRAAAVVQGASGFNEEALRTAQQWMFRPARHNGVPVSAFVYIVFGFRRPLH